ncbi:hypothetical protein CLOP_g20632 [Closterium sp. NIES-67]|nr:hypothetical protein CLOP_g20632 [Closterium sp. NIES-67]
MENEATDINKLCASVPDDLAKIIREYPDIFPDDLPSGLPPERPQDHKIELEPGMQPTVRTQWRLTQPELHELRNQLDYLLAKGFIRPSTSPFAAPIWFTPKRDGGLCMCTDYRALNWVTIKSRYPIARKGELIDKLRGARYFSKIDLRGSYHQIRVFADICHETALRTRYESYEYMPFEVITDARDIAIGAVLMQDFGNGLQPIAYESRKMQSAECNYQVYDKEMLAIVHTFKIWRCYLIGADVTVRTNQKSLQYLRAQPNLNPGRYAGWTIWNMVTDVQHYVAVCPICQRMKSSHQRPTRLLQPLEPPQRPWQHVTMDFVTGLPAGSSKNDAVLVVIDQLTKTMHFAPCCTTITAEETARLFISTVVRLHGIPAAIIRGRDPKFTSNFWQDMWARYGMRLQFSSAYHPQTDGQTERTNQMMEQLIWTNCSDRNKWEDALPMLEFSYNNAPSSTTNHSPFYINYGMDPTVPISTNVER